MWFLVFSITCSVSVSILLKLARRYSIHVSQAIAANYVMASALTLLLLQPRLDNLWQPGLPLVVLLLLGLLLPSIFIVRSEEHTSELQSRGHLVCRLLLEK